MTDKQVAVSMLSLVRSNGISLLELIKELNNLNAKHGGVLFKSTKGYLIMVQGRAIEPILDVIVPKSLQGAVNEHNHLAGVVHCLLGE